MSKSNLYNKVLKLYKQLYITRNQTFQEDTPRLKTALDRLRNEFRLNKNETDNVKIEQLIKTGKEVDRILRNQVLQTVKVNDNLYKLKVKPYMIKDNHTSN